MPPSDQSIKRAELYFDEILNQFKIQNFTTYDAKHKYLETYVIDFENGTKMPLKQLINDNPLLKEKIDSHMVHSVINEDGNPLTNQFDFSKEISDKKLFEALDKATELKAKYDSLGGANKEEELAKIMEEKNDLQAGYDEEINQYTKAIDVLRNEFDERVWDEEGWGFKLVGKKDPLYSVFDEDMLETGGIFNLLYGATYPVRRIIPPLAKTITQPINFLVDLGLKNKGMEVIENRSYNYDPVNQRYGMGDDVKDLQKILGPLYDKRSELSYDYQEETDAYQELVDLRGEIKASKDIVNSTRLDELMKDGYTGTLDLINYLKPGE